MNTMYNYESLSDERTSKLIAAGYQKDKLFSYPEIAQWMGDVCDIIISVERFTPSDFPTLNNKLCIVYLRDMETVKVGCFSSYSSAIKAAVNFVIDERYDYISKSYLELNNQYQERLKDNFSALSGNYTTLKYSELIG